MKTISLFLLNGLILGGAVIAGGTAAYRWEVLPDDTGLALVNATNGLPVWRAVCDPKQPKPYVYPLATTGGIGLTADAPADHIWHKSLWFAWKYINGVNYWEYEKKTGQSQGRTVITSSKCEPGDDYSARVALEIDYVPPTGTAVLREKRVLSFGAPRADGSYAIDWDATFTVGDKEIKLDRTPPSATSGGYAGLSLRFPKGIKGWAFLTSGGAANAAQGNGKNARWVDFRSPAAGIAVFDHPANPRHPTWWYLNESLPYFSPALIYREPMTLAAGATMRLRYRVLVHEGAADKARLDREFDAFAGTP